MNCLWTPPWLSKKQISMDLIFHLLIRAFFGRGELTRVPLRTLSFGFGIVLENPRFSPVMTCLKKLFIFDAFKKVQAHIPSAFHLFVGEGFFGTSFAQIFSMPNSSVKTSWTVWWLKFNSLPITLSNVDQTSQQPSLRSHFRQFLTCTMLQNEVRLPNSHGHPKMLYAT